MTGKYLTPDDLRRMGMKPLQVRGVREELIDGWPSLVVYFSHDERGLVLTKQLADEFIAVLGPNEFVSGFFDKERTKH